MEKQLLSALLLLGVLGTIPPAWTQESAPANPTEAAADPEAQLKAQLQQLLARGQQQNRDRQSQQAISAFKQVLGLSQPLGYQDMTAAALIGLGRSYLLLDKPQEAIRYFGQAAPVFRKMNNRPGEASTFYSLGASYHRLGDRNQARDYFNQALELYRQAEDRSGESAALSQLRALDRPNPTVSQP
ncbi:MAG: tetratricopeptide repeat protein [Chloroflexaceae bacterium]|nr:tetratricopeptide repeat protein [Chloroflexaceae bacterium]